MWKPGDSVRLVQTQKMATVTSVKRNSREETDATVLWSDGSTEVLDVRWFRSAGSDPSLDPAMVSVGWWFQAKWLDSVWPNMCYPEKLQKNVEGVYRWKVPSYGKSLQLNRKQDAHELKWFHRVVVANGRYLLDQDGPLPPGQYVVMGTVLDQLPKKVTPVCLSGAVGGHMIFLRQQDLWRLDKGLEILM
jgi:hypothetical protein